MFKKILKILFYLMIFVAVAGASVYITATFILQSEDTVVVPELVGKEAVYALQMLSDLGVNTKVRGSEYSSAIPKNHIIYQSPEAGSEIKKGRDVKIIISKGTQSLRLPNLAGISIRQAHIILDENDLKLGVQSETYTENIEKGLVMAQTPSPGSAAARGSTVNLLVSSGIRPKTFMMPDLSGLSPEEAVLVIEKSKLEMGENISRFHKDRPRNTVVGQEPLSGYRVTEGRRVNLVVNRKPGTAQDRDASGPLFRFRIEKGFLKRHILVDFEGFGISNRIFDEFVQPGEEIWMMFPKGEDVTVSLYEDDELIKSRSYDSW